jgi:hypothetical protein
MDDLNKLLEQSSSTDLATLLNAKEEAKRRVLTDPTPANLAALDRATKMMESYHAQKEQIFSNRMEVLHYLESQGYKIKKSKLYRDCDKGLLKVETNGTVKKSSVDIYIMHPLANLIGPDTPDDDYLQQKTEYEIRRLQAQVEQIEFRNELERSLHIPREQYYRRMADNALIFKSDLMTYAYSDAAIMTEIVKGDPAYIPDLIEYMLNKHAQILSRYAHDIPIPVPEETEHENDHIHAGGTADI